MTDLRKNTVPLKKVVLYKHGMGYFERRGTVDGGTSIEILCGAAEIDDMLKSLMVLTSDGARIDAITYDSAKTLEDRMTEFGFDVRSADGLIDIISQMKGLPITVVASGSEVSGRVVGLDYLEQMLAGDRIIREPFLIMLKGPTFQRLSLASISSITVDDASFSAELNQQLELLFQNAKKKDKKALTVILPDTKGEVVVAYSIPSPIWKTSYRLVLVGDKLLMQGMAIVDNVQDEDWQDVQVVLVSAAPISFIQPLYDPVQPERRRIAAQGYKSAGPVVAERAQRSERMRTKKDTPQFSLAEDSESWSAQAAPAGPGAYGGGMAGFAEQARLGVMMQAAVEQERLPVEAGSSGELFEYRVATPVTVPRNTSALIPIVQEAIEGERISLFNSEKNRKHPYCAIRLRNTSGLTLESGPVTVVEEDSYAGEALLDVLKPDDVRLLPYALDQDCHVIIRRTHEEKPIWRVRLIAQTLYMDFRTLSVTIYRVENLGDRPKVVYVEHPVNVNSKLVGEHAPAETTDSYHRFELKLEAKQLHELSVVEEQEVARTIWVADPDSLDTHSLRWLVEQNIVNKDMNGFIQTLMKKQAEIADLLEKRKAVQVRIQQYSNDQARARENLKAVGATNERYRRAIDVAEDKIITSNAELETLINKYNERRRDFEQFVQQQIEAEVL